MPKLKETVISKKPEDFTHHIFCNKSRDSKKRRTDLRSDPKKHPPF